MLDLRTFIKETLVEIAQGVADARQAIEPLGGKVNPKGLTIGGDIVKQSMFSRKDNDVCQMIRFNVALTAIEEGATATKVGVFAAIAGAGAEANDKLTSSTVSRVEFAVPLLLP
jgi:hypothetical protein